MPSRPDDIRRNYLLAIEAKKQRLRAGLYAGGLLIQRRAMEHTPVEDGALRASAYTQFAPDNPNQVNVGYTQDYAAAVHEKPGTLAGQPRPSGKGVYWGPDGYPQFLRRALEESLKDVVSLVKSYGGLR